MEALDYQGKNLVLIVLRQTQNFVSVYVIMLITVVCLLMEKKSLNLKLTKNINFLSKFCFGNICNRFSAIESRKISLNGNVYYFSMCMTY